MTNEELLSKNAFLSSENTSAKKEVAYLKEQLAQLYKLLNGFKPESFTTDTVLDQLSLFGQDPASEVEQPPK